MNTTPKMAGADTDGDIKHCTCSYPSGFIFISNTSDHQVWEHVECGGLVTRIFVRYGDLRSL